MSFRNKKTCSKNFTSQFFAIWLQAFGVFSVLFAPLSFAQDSQSHTNSMQTMSAGHAHAMPAKSMPAAMHEQHSNRDASGTSWQPDSTPMVGVMFMPGEWTLMLSGFANAIYDNQGGPRGDDKSFSTNMLMFMAHRPLGIGTFGFHSMLSLEPLMGKSGYPLLLQTGETANGITPLIDRQHPHDLFMELATTYSIPLTEQLSVFAYAGLPGEPALGPPVFMSRWSAMYIPEAPLSHHWLDSTHITYGVTTLGIIWNGIKLEASAFKGREPDQFRWNIESPKLDSNSMRLSYNPTANWSLQVSYGHIVSPEQLQPWVNTNRTTASASYNKPLGADSNWQTTFAWGQNANHPGNRLDAYLLESTLNLKHDHTVFGRFENLEEDELLHDEDPLADQVFTVNKLSLGYMYNFPKLCFHLQPSIGGLVSTYWLPHAIRKEYGDHPLSYMLFGRIGLE